jgi:predicted ATPase/DNA-binding NarL/FixJ family response regulator/DNA-binding XRE family transcriptional regulator
MLQQLRRRAGLSQQELAERAGLSVRGIADLERGARRTPYPRTVRRLVEALGLDEEGRAGLVAAAQPGTPASGPAQIERTRSLPLPFGSFVGRERELAEVKGLLEITRLVTLTGTGGIGKTRLALEVARASTDVTFVDLSSLSHPSQVIPTVAGALGIRERTEQSLFERMVRVLAGRQHLLVLDNFEHLLAAAPQVSELLADCPGLKILATSRAALRVRWEQEIPVAPLALPEPPQLADLEALAEIPSVSLFVERARSACPAFDFGRDNAASVVEICRGLDGLPLALELAAARTRLLPPQVLASRLASRLPSLGSGPRDAPARQRTLRASIAWSYELLNEHDQRLFRRLGVFTAGARLEQAEQVCRQPDELDWDVLDGLAALVEHSLARWETVPDREPRLRMLETIREFALEQLEASGEADAIRRCHALAYVALANAAGPELFGSQRAARVRELAADFDNLRTALMWLLDHGEAELGCDLTGALTWWWYPLGRVSTGRDWVEQALVCTRPDDRSPAHAGALFSAGVLALFTGEVASARRRLDESACHYAQLGDVTGQARAHLYLGIALGADDPTRARRLQEEALAVFHGVGDPRMIAMALLCCGDRAFAANEFGPAREFISESLTVFRELGDTLMAAEALNKLGDLARRSGESRRAAALYSESLELMRQDGEGGSGVPGLLHNLAYVSQEQGEHRRALGHFSEALALFAANADQRGIAECLVGVAGVALALGQPEQGARLLGAVDVCLEDARVAMASGSQTEYQRLVMSARARLGASAFSSARQAGRAMSLRHASAQAATLADLLPEATDRQNHRNATAWSDTLTPREREVAVLLAGGLRNREIASQLIITEQTVETHVKRLLSKLGLASRHQIRGWIDQSRQPG